MLCLSAEINFRQFLPFEYFILWRKYSFIKKNYLVLNSLPNFNNFFNLTEKKNFRSNFKNKLQSSEFPNSKLVVLVLDTYVKIIIIYERQQNVLIITNYLQMCFCSIY